MNFKIGDKVEATQKCSGTEIGKTYTVKDSGGGLEIVGCICSDTWKPITRNNTKEKPIKFVAVYEERGGDPLEKFTSKAGLNKWIREARENENIIFNSIKVYEVKKEYEIKLNFSLRAKKF